MKVFEDMLSRDKMNRKEIEKLDELAKYLDKHGFHSIEAWNGFRRGISDILEG